MTEARGSSEFRRGFEVLDLDDGVGWELLQAMIRFKGRQRISVKQALDHPYFIRDGLLGLTFLQKLRLQVIRASFQDRGEVFAWIQNMMAKSGTKSVGGFTEAELQKMKVRISALTAISFLADHLLDENLRPNKKILVPTCLNSSQKYVC